MNIRKLIAKNPCPNCIVQACCTEICNGKINYHNLIVQKRVEYADAYNTVGTNYYLEMFRKADKLLNISSKDKKIIYHRRSNLNLHNNASISSSSSSSTSP